MTTSRRITLVLGAIAVTALLALSGCTVPAQPPTIRVQKVLPAECPAGGGPEVAPRTVGVNGRLSALIPPANYQPGVAYPLVLSMHPFILDNVSWENYSQLAARAAARGYWVLTPRGSEPGPRWSVPGGIDTGVDDIGWLDDLIVTAANTVCIDRDRIFAAGFSAGAAMAVGLTCELPWRFAAVVASGGSNLTSLCPSVGGTDALIIHGTADPIAPPSGQTIEFLPPTGISVDAVVSTFATRDGCGAPTSVVKTATVTAQVYPCDGHRLEYWPVRGMGHTWASAAFPLDLVTGPTDTTFSASNVALDFFDAT